MKSSALAIVLSLMVLVAIGFTAFTWIRTHAEPDRVVEITGSLPHKKGAEPEALPQTLGHFELTLANGKPFDSRTLSGDVWVGSFFFSTCPSSCVRLNLALADLQRDPNLKEVQFVSITCDPETDTGPVLTEYASRFEANPARWRFCRGALDYVQQVGANFFGYPVKEKDHSNRATIVDRNGKVRGRYNMLLPDDIAMMKKVLAKCLAEPRPSATGDIPGGPPEPADEATPLAAAAR